MVIVDQTLRSLLATLTPADKAILFEAIREGGQWPADAKAVLRWLRRRLKRKARGRPRARR